MVLVRTVFALLFAGPLFLTQTVAPALQAQTYTAVVTMSAPSPGVAQFFYDDGSGYAEAHSVRVPAENGRHAYRFPVPFGTYREFRIDPGVQGGQYVIDSLVIEGRGGAVFLAVPPERFGRLHELTVVERSATRLVLEGPSGASDPFIVIPLPEPIALLGSATTPGHFARALVGWWGLLLIVVVVVERAVGARSARLVTWWQRRWSVLRQHAVAVIVATAALATAAAMHPLILDHRSLVTPSNGPLPMLYETLPLIPGSSDFGIEDTRGSDVGAMLWAFLSYSHVQRDALIAGEWPLWMRQNGSGRPLWGQGQSFLLDPLHWLTFVKANPAPGWDLKFVAHRFVFCAGIGVASWLATASLPAALAAAAVTPFAGLYIYRFNHPATFAVSYGPLILVAWFLLGRASDWRQRARAAALLALASSLVLVASPPKEGMAVLMGCELTGALSLLLVGTPVRWRLAGFVAAGAAGLTTVLLTAPHWLVFLDTLAAARTAYDTPAAHFGTRESAIGLVLANLTPFGLQPGLHAIGLVFAVVCVVSPRQLNERRELAACAAGAVGLIALAFGALPKEWLLQVPLVRNISHVADVMTSAALIPTLVLTAGGLAAIVRRSPAVAWLLTVGFASAAAFLLRETGGFAAFQEFGQWARFLVLALSAVAPLVVVAAHRHAGRVLPAVCAVGLCGLVVLPGGLHFTTGIPPLDAVLAQPRPRVDLNANSPATDAARMTQHEPARAVGIGVTLFNGTPALYELDGIGGPDALALGSYEELLDAGGMFRDWGWLTLVLPDRRQQVAPLLDLLNVGLFVGQQDYFGAKPWPDLDGDPRLDVTTRATAWPRAFFVDAVEGYQTPQDLLSRARDAGRPMAGAQLTDREAVRLTAPFVGRARAVVPARDYVLTANTTSFTVDAPGPGVVVLTESYMARDFRLTLNGRPATYFRVNHAFKGAIVPAAGSWAFHYEYRPARWTMAWVCATAGVLLWLAICVVATGRTGGSRRTA